MSAIPALSMTMPTALPITLAVPGTDFEAFQPGPLNASTGWREHTVEVEFVLDTAVPDEGCVLRLEFAAGHGPCPDLVVVLDGRHRGFFHPVVRRDDRSETYRHGPIAGDVTLDVPLPAAWLTAGQHRLTLTTTLDSAAATGPVSGEDVRLRHRPQFGNHFGSGLTWHALTLLSGAAASPQSQVTLVATPLYIRDGEDGLAELLELTVSVAAGFEAPAEAEVRVAGHVYVHDLLRDDRDFGHVRVVFPVPEFTGATSAEVFLDKGFAARVELQAARKWTLHLIPHVHLDVGYTDSQGKVFELHSRNLDRAVAALERDDGFAFSVDGSLIVDQYLATRSGPRVERLLEALRGGRLSVNAFHSLFLSGTASLEEIFRAAYAAARLRDEHGVPITYANLTDVPSYSAALPGILTALGIEAFVGIENHHRGGNADSDTQHLLSPVMWEGIDGSRVLTHFSDTYSQLRFMVGDPQTIAGGAHAFGRLLARYDRPDYLPHDLPVIGTHADNEDLADGDAGFAARWNARYAFPRLAVSTMADYLATVRPLALADRLPVWRGDGGSYWEDGVGTGAAITAEHRGVQTQLPAAEGLAALVAHADDGYGYAPNRAQLDAAWEGALFGCEHTWTWAHANAHPHGEQVGDQLDWKRHQVHQAHRVAADETRRALSQLAESVTSAGPSLLVYNPLSWPRDVEVEFETTHAAPLDAEVLSECNGLRRMRMTVPAVPGFGYRVLALGRARELAPGAEDGAAVADTIAGPDAWHPIPATFTTERWTIGLDPSGTITALKHLPTGRHLLTGPLAQILYAANGPVSLTRGDHTGVPHTHPPAPRSTLSGRRPKADPPDLTVTPASMRPIGIHRTYDGWRIRTVGSAPSVPHIEVDVLLRDHSDRIDVTVRLDKERVLAKEALYVAFPFAAKQPRIHYDRQQGWINPAADHAPGACQDWFTTQYGVVVDSGKGTGAVAWSSADAPLFTVGDIVRGAWRERFEPGDGTLHSWVINNYWPTNTPPEQDGSLVLRYSFQPLPSFDPVTAGRFGREARAPAVATEITWLDKFDTDPRPLPAAGALLDLGLPSSVHATVAAPRSDPRDNPRSGPGLLLRLQNLGGHPQQLLLRHPGGPDAQATLCLADERPIAPLPLTPEGLFPVELGAWQVASVILRAKGE